MSWFSCCYQIMLCVRVSRVYLRYSWSASFLLASTASSGSIAGTEACFSVTEDDTLLWEMDEERAAVAWPSCSSPCIVVMTAEFILWMEDIFFFLMIINQKRKKRKCNFQNYFRSNLFFFLWNMGTDGILEFCHTRQPHLTTKIPYRRLNYTWYFESSILRSIIISDYLIN